MNRNVPSFQFSDPIGGSGSSSPVRRDVTLFRGIKVH